MSKNIKKLIKNKIKTLVETEGFEDMEVAFGVKEKSDNLSNAEKKQFGKWETIQDEEGVKLGDSSAQPALNKVHKEDKKDADTYYKEVDKKMKDFQQTDESEPSQIGEAFNPPKINREDDQTEPDEVYSTEALGPGMLALKYDNEATPVHKKFEERMEDMNGDDLTYKKLRAYSEKYLKHKYEKPSEYHKTPKVRVTNESISMDDEKEKAWKKFQKDNHVTSKTIKVARRDFEKEYAKKDSVDDTKKSTYNEEGEIYGKIEEYSDVLKENIFKVKNTIKSKEQVLKLVSKLPKRVRVDETEFAVTDGENYYKLLWEGMEDGEAVIINEMNTKVVKENINKMKSLWNFKSSDKISTKKTIKEGSDDVFFKMMNKLRG